MAMTIQDAKIAIGMLARGDNQHDVAAWFGENQARIVEASQGKYGTTEAAPASELPPKGPPGIKGRRLLLSLKRPSRRSRPATPTKR